VAVHDQLRGFGQRVADVDYLVAAEVAADYGAFGTPFPYRQTGGISAAPR
jgi:hypothetical protein